MHNGMKNRRRMERGGRAYGRKWGKKGQLSPSKRRREPLPLPMSICQAAVPPASLPNACMFVVSCHTVYYIFSPSAGVSIGRGDKESTAYTHMVQGTCLSPCPPLALKLKCHVNVMPCMSTMARHIYMPCMARYYVASGYATRRARRALCEGCSFHATTRVTLS